MDQIAKMFTKEKMDEYLAKLDTFGDGVPTIKAAATQLKTRTAYVVLGGAGLVSFLLFSVLGIGFFVDVIVGFAYPAFVSFKAIETENKNDDRRWLTYWVVFALIHVIESFAGFIVRLIPFYFVIKCLFYVACFNDNIRLSETIYTAVVQPFFTKHADAIDQAVSQVQSGLGNALKRTVAAASEGDDGEETDPADIADRAAAAGGERKRL